MSLWWLTRVLAPVAGLAATAIALERSPYDRASLEPFFDAESGTFPLRRGWLFENVLHVGGKWAVIACTAAFLVVAVIGWRRPSWSSAARRYGYLAACLLATVAITGAWKKLAGQVTPWDTIGFGGRKPWPSVAGTTSAWAAIGSPGAHASSGFAWVSLYFVAASLGVRRRWMWLAPGLMLGFLFALGQHARGAHQPSHELWSIAVAWVTACGMAAAFRAFGWLTWAEVPTGTSNEHAEDPALPGVVGATAALCGMAYFAADQVSNEIEQAYPSFHGLFVASELMVMTIGLGAAAWLTADKLVALRARAARRVDEERERRFQVLGRMAASVAHEVRNPLQTVRLIVDEQRHEVPGLRDHPLQAEFESSLERIDRAVDLVYRLARPESGEAETADLAQAARDSVLALSRITPRRVSFAWEHEPPRAPVASSRSALRIVIDNLLRNAADASPEGGTVLLDLDRHEDDWTLRIRNRGRLGQRAQSSREAGLGLGVPISRQIAGNAGGGIEIAEADGCVTCTLRWPRGGSTA